MSQHSHAEILSVFANIVTEHVAALRDALIKLGEPGASDEDLHQFRVTLRRLRSAWVTFAPVLPRAFITEWKPRLRTLAGATGPVREWDVLITDWLPAAQAVLSEGDEAGRAWLAAAIERAKQARHLAWQTLRVELASPSVMNALTELEGGVAAFRLSSKPPRLAGFAHARAAALRKKVLRRGHVCIVRALRPSSGAIYMKRFTPPSGHGPLSATESTCASSKTPWARSTTPASL